mgnify:CR=1 FL=1
MMQRAGSMKKWDMNKSVSVNFREAGGKCHNHVKGWRTA